MYSCEPSWRAHWHPCPTQETSWRHILLLTGYPCFRGRSRFRCANKLRNCFTFLRCQQKCWHLAKQRPACEPHCLHGGNISIPRQLDTELLCDNWRLHFRAQHFVVDQLLSAKYFLTSLKTNQVGRTAIVLCRNHARKNSMMQFQPKQGDETPNPLSGGFYTDFWTAMLPLSGLRGLFRCQNVHKLCYWCDKLQNDARPDLLVPARKGKALRAWALGEFNVDVQDRDNKAAVRWCVSN